MYTGELQCKRAFVTNGMANSGADGNSIKSIFQENRISSFNFHSALFVSCLYVYKWRGRGDCNDCEKRIRAYLA